MIEINESIKCYYQFWIYMLLKQKLNIIIVNVNNFYIIDVNE